MSMLIAGITGFLKERNVMAGEEAAARAKIAEAKAERETLLMTNLYKAATDPNYQQSPEFQQELKEKGLEPFIRASNALADVGTKTYFGPTTLGISLPYNHSKKDPKQRPGANMISFNEYVLDPTRAEELRNKILQDPTGAAAKAIASYVTTNFAQEQLNRLKTENKDQSVVISKDLYGSAFEFLDTLQSGLGVPKSQNKQTILNEEINNISKETGPRPENSVYVRGMKVEQGYKPGGFVPLEQQEYQDVDFLAGRLNLTVDELTANLQDYSYSDTDINQQINGLKNGARLLRAGVLDFGNPTQSATAKQNVMDILQDISLKAGDDAENAIMSAMYVVSNLLPKDPAESLLSSSTELPIKTGADVLGSQQAADNITKRFDAQNNVIQLATQLRENRKLLKTSGAARIIQKGIAGLFSSTGQISQIAGFFASQSDKNHDGTMGKSAVTEETLMNRYANYAKTRGYNLEKVMTESQVLEFNLAVQIARAADPNGRLSNQDFENALKTLGTGGIFSSLDMDVGALDTTIEIYTKRRDNLKYMAGIAASKNVSPKQVQALNAYRLYKDVKNNLPEMPAENLAGSTPVAPTVEELVSGYIDVSQGYNVQPGTSVYQKGRDMFSVSGDGVVVRLETPPPRIRRSPVPAAPAASAVTPTASAVTPSRPAGTDQLIPAIDFAGKKSKTLMGGFVEFDDEPGVTYQKIVKDKRIFYKKIGN